MLVYFQSVKVQHSTDFCKYLEIKNEICVAFGGNVGMMLCRVRLYNGQECCVCG